MKAIILAAGFGTRMLPVTKTIPKELLPVGDKPVIQYTVEALVDAGIDDIIIVTSQGKRALEDYFDKNYELEEMLKKKGKIEFLEAINRPKNLAKIAFIKQSEPLGVGHAILQAEPWITDDFFMVLNGDDIYHPQSIKDMVNLHLETKKSAMLLTEVEKNTVDKWGIAEIRDNKIVDIIEKPSIDEAPSNYANTGAVIYPNKIFDLLKQTQPDPKSGEIYPWDALREVMKIEGVLPYVSPYTRRSIGTRDGRLAANVEIAENGSLF